MAVLWGTLTSLMIGFGDLAYARVSNRMSVITLMIMSSIGGVGVGVLALLVIDSELSSNAIVVGVSAGAVMGAALAFYLQAMKVTTISISSPITAVLAALVPLMWEIVVDDRVPSGLVVGGAVVALVSLTVTTWSPESKGHIRLGAQWAVLSGSCYGVGNLLLGQAAEGSGVWPAIAHRSIGVVMFAVLALALGLPRLPPISTRRAVLIGGVLGNIAIVCFLFGVETGDLGVLSVTASLFPTVSVTLLFLFAGHSVRWWQGIGVLGAVAGVVLIAVG
ncbi:MAG: DMT family transporter [Acidimicrobiales bacterium]|jgi:drug/metabolite transporter (DMT)-like permease|nr:DMT family transporter [Acidimicrobiales bacterium]